MNARSIVNKVDELQVLATNMDVLAITETWLTPVINSCEILPNMNFTIHRRDRFEHNNKRGGGVLLVVRNTVPCVRRPGLETSAEIVVCELRPSCKKKILMAVFYRPPSSDYLCLKEFMKFLDQASRAKFDQLLIVGDFNLPDVDWATVTASIDCQMYTLFTKAIKDHFLWQFIDFPTRNDHILDLLFTNIPDKISNFKGSQDILNSDHQLIEFSLDLRIKSQPHIKRRLYSFKKADWNGLKHSLSLINWDLCFEENDINASLTNWSDTFLAAVNQHIPTSKPRNVNEHPWIDHELLNRIKVKNKLRKAVIKRGSTLDHDRFRQARREVKAMIKMKKKQYAAKLKDSLLTNIRRFWSLVKSMTEQNRSLGFLRDGQRFVTNNKEKANLLNNFFQSVFSPNNGTSESYQEPSTIPVHHLSEIPPYNFRGN